MYYNSSNDRGNDTSVSKTSCKRGSPMSVLPPALLVVRLAEGGSQRQRTVAGALVALGIYRGVFNGFQLRHLPTLLYGFRPCLYFMASVLPQHRLCLIDGSYTHNAWTFPRSTNRRRENMVEVNMVLAEYHRIQTWLL